MIRAANFDRPADLRASLIREKVSIRNPCYFSEMISYVASGYGCTKSQAAGIIEAARSQGLMKDLPHFRLQILEHDTLEV